MALQWAKTGQGSGHFGAAHGAILGKTLVAMRKHILTDSSSVEVKKARTRSSLHKVVVLS